MERNKGFLTKKGSKFNKYFNIFCCFYKLVLPSHSINFLSKGKQCLQYNN